MIFLGTLFSSSVKMNTGWHFSSFYDVKGKVNKNNVIYSEKCDWAHTLHMVKSSD